MRAALSAFTSALCLVGCSLVKLSSDIEQEQCSSNADCEVLNDREAEDFDPCRLWQCAETSYCEVLPLDEDGDGFSPHTTEHDGEEVVCEAEASRRDCADSESLSNPDEPEQCDELDNDCDQEIDEGVLEDKTLVASAFADENAEGAGEVSYAIDPDSGLIAAAYGISRGASSVPGLSTLPSSLAAGSPATEIELPSGSGTLLLREPETTMGVGALGGDRFAVAFVQGSGTRRLVAGIVVERGSSLELSVDAGVLLRGLRCADDEACAANVSYDPMLQGAVLEPIPETSTPALAALDDDVLVVYTRLPSDTACGEGQVSPVLATHLAHTASGASLAEQGAAVALGQSRDASEPAVLALPAFQEGGASVGWLTAIANADGAVELRGVRVQGGALQVGDPLLTLSSEDGYRDVSLALGPMDGAERVIGLAAQRGCGVQARIAFSVLRASGEGGELAIERAAGDLLVGGAANESRPSVAYSEKRNAFVVAYRDPSGLRARVLDQEGTVLGDEAYTLLRNVDSGASPLRVTSSPLSVPLEPGAGWFGAVVATQSNEDRALQAVTLSSCP